MTRLSDAQLLVLSTLAASAGDPMEVPVVHERTGLTRPTLHRVIHGLQDDGMVESRSSSVTGRSAGRPRLVLAMTAAGWQALRAHRQDLEAELQQVDAVLSALDEPAG